MMKYFLYANTFVAVLAFLNIIILNLDVKKRYRYKYKVGLGEKAVRLAAGIMFCFVPILNIVVALFSKDLYFEHISKDEDYERIL